jgi:cytochrome b involved in lipid metabolism
LAFVREVVHDVVGYIVDHYCLVLVRGVVHDVVGYKM